MRIQFMVQKCFHIEFILIQFMHGQSVIAFLHTLHNRSGDWSVLLTLRDASNRVAGSICCAAKAWHHGNKTSYRITYLEQYIIYSLWL